MRENWEPVPPVRLVIGRPLREGRGSGTQTRILYPFPKARLAATHPS
jgi:hypothetical protein